MNRSMFWRLVWKEYRLQRALWIAMFALTALALALGFAYLPPQDRPKFLFLVAGGLPAFCLLGSGAMLFAGEREAGTYEFQRALPVGAGRVVAAKLVFALAAATIMFGLLGLGAFFLSGRTLPRPPQFSPFALGFFGLEMLLWATLFSLLTQRVLVAAVLGVAAASLSVQMLAELTGSQFRDAVAWRYWAVMPERMALAAVVALIDVWLGTRWFRQRSDRRLRGSGPPCGDASARDQSGDLSPRLHAPERLAILGRLMWQHWRQSAWLLAVVGVLLVPGAISVVEWLIRTLADEPWRSGPTPERQVACWLAIDMALASIPLLGLCAFLPDQWGRSYRFLADRGVPPKYVWLSRQLMTVFAPILLLAAILVAAILLATFLLPMIPRAEPREFENVTKTVFMLGYTILGVFGYFVLCLAAGQFCSMVFRSGILAGLFTLLLSALLAAWGALMLFWDVNWLWSVLPIPLALLLATRLRTRDWLLERNALRTCLWPAVALVVPAVPILTAVPLYRIYQAPDVDPGFSVAQYERPMTAEEKGTMNLYRQAVEALHEQSLSAPSWNLLFGWKRRALTPAEIAVLDGNQQALTLALRASRGRFFYPIDDDEELRRIGKLAEWSLLEAIRLQDEGKLEAALEHYLAAIRICAQIRSCDLRDSWSADSVETAVNAHLRDWAACPHQTPARILAAERQLSKATPLASFTAPFRFEYFRLRQILQGDFAAIAAITEAVSGRQKPLPLPVWLWLRLPWERARALRLLNAQTRLQFRVASRWHGRNNYRLALRGIPSRSSFGRRCSLSSSARR